MHEDDIRICFGAIERGEQNLSLQNFERVAATLGLSLADLIAPFTDKSDPPS